LEDPIVHLAFEAEALCQEGVQRRLDPLQQTRPLRLDENSGGAQHPQAELAGKSTRLSVVEDEPRTLEFEPQAQDLGLTGAEARSDHPVIGWPSWHADVDPSWKSRPAACCFRGDRRWDGDPAEESRQDLELVDPAEADERAGVG
jgi:hypothetical protein